KILFLPAMVIAKQIAMIGEEANQRILWIWTCFNAIENPSETRFDIGDFAIVTCLYDPSQRRVNRIRPDRVAHEGDLFIHVVGVKLPKYRIRHAIWIVHTVKWNRRRDRWMWSDE